MLAVSPLRERSLVLFCPNPLSCPCPCPLSRTPRSPLAPRSLCAYPLPLAPLVASDRLQDFKFFSPETAATFLAAAARIIPEDESSRGGGTVEVLRTADRMIASRPSRDQKMLRLFLGAVERLPLLRYGRTFSKLTPERQDAFLDFLENNRALSKLRQGFFGLKTFALMGYYGSEDCFAEIGYDGPRRDAPFYVLRQRNSA